MKETSKITAHRAFQTLWKTKRKTEPSRLSGLARRALTQALFSFLLCALVGFQGMPALAAAVSFTPNPNTNGGNIIGRIPMTKLGNLKLPRGRAYFKSNEL